jgi:hypothetical protein
MRLASLLSLLAQAKASSGHSEFVVIGSLSILGMEPAAEIPPGMSMSIDVDAYTRADPGRIFDLLAELGEDSPFHRAHGIYLDGVTPSLPTLPDGWEARMLKIEQDGLVVWFLEPHDAAVSKLARGQPNDLRWVQEGTRSGLVSAPLVRARFASTRFLDSEEAQRARLGLEQAAG